MQISIPKLEIITKSVTQMTVKLMEYDENVKRKINIISDLIEQEKIQNKAYRKQVISGLFLVILIQP